MSDEPTHVSEALDEALDQLKERSRQQGAAMDDEQVVQERHSAEMIRRPRLWPHSLLPLKKEGTWEVASLKPLDDGRYVVFENLSLFGPVGNVTPHIFQDPEDIILAGWVVD